MIFSYSLNIIRQQAVFTPVVDILAKMEFLLDRHSKHTRESSKSTLPDLLISVFGTEKMVVISAHAMKYVLIYLDMEIMIFL